MAHGGKRAGAGRPKGSVNKITQGVAEKLEELGCDPIEGLATIAKDEGLEASLRFQAYKELANYVAPKRKSVEHTGADGGAMEHEYIININGKSPTD